MRFRSAGLLLLLGILVMVPRNGYAQEPFGECADRTASNASIIIPQTALLTRDGGPLAEGSRIAAYTPDGICAGTAVWNGTASAFAAWADDPMNPMKDGAELGEHLTFRIWDADTRRQYEAQADLEDGISLDGSNGLFSADAVYVLQSLTAQTPIAQGADDTQPESLELRLSESYPNPFSAETTIPFDVASPQPVVLEVFNTTGARVATLLDGAVLNGHQEIRWSPDGLPAGLYMIRLRVGDAVRTGSIVHVD